ncbi:MAG: hypothetical protein MZV63_22610 [Marinilabiliales bacterium]|nr:hypothetical protein [Marinilabiliales bacterium]
MRYSDMIFETGNKIADFPNLRSIHAGGVLISEEPVCCYTALDMPPKGVSDNAVGHVHRRGAGLREA